jgi:hypothetical protein
MSVLVGDELARYAQTFLTDGLCNSKFRTKAAN